MKMTQKELDEILKQSFKNADATWTVENTDVDPLRIKVNFRVRVAVSSNNEWTTYFRCVGSPADTKESVRSWAEAVMEEYSEKLEDFLRNVVGESKDDDEI